MFDLILKCGTHLTLSDLEKANLSYVPCGQVNGKDQPLLTFAHLWGHRNHITRQTYGKKWFGYSMRNMNGVQLMTGFSSYRRVGKSDYLYYTSLDIERRMIENYPDEVERIRKLYEDNVIGTPCILATKSDGLRLDAYTDYVGKKMSFRDDTKKMLFEVLADKCLTRIDHRYAMVSGSLLNIPTLPKETLQDIYHIISEIATHEQSDSKPREIVETSQIGDLDIQWGADGRSQLFPTAHCQRTSHSSNRDEVRFTKHADGSVDGKCFNCGETWWEIEPPKPKRKSKPCIQPITTLPPDHPIIASAPPVEIRENPSFRYFSPEERHIVKDVLSLDPDAGWHGQTPIFTTRYEYLHPLTHKFKLNGQPSEVEKRRVWSTLFGKCTCCGSVTAQWVDRYLLTAGLYCDGCHKDYHLGSYLELELDRKLPNSIISKHQGFLGDDPEFQDFRLWEPRTLTHLGAGMATGKSTEIYKAMIALALQGLGKGIIAVPRVSLARFLAHYLRGKYGYLSWGLWHEGCQKSDKFIGDFGAIVCLPSLPIAVAEAEKNEVSQLYIAIDEVDFGYSLLSLAVEQATAVKKCLRDALNTTGLVVSGQTEATLALEALAEEIGAEQVQGFYNTAKPADGSVVMHKHANVEGKSSSILSGGLDDVSMFIDAGHNVYVFCSSRRDGDVIVDEFQHYNPVVYNSYTKGDPRCDAVLKNQCLPEGSRLFIGTSAAGVGISILDPKAKTVILNGLNYGSRDASMTVQTGVRDRRRCGMSLHYADYNLSLPVRPSENEIVSIYRESLKAAESPFTDVSREGIRKIAYAQALTSLADTQIEAFIKYHLGEVGNMEVYQASALPQETERLAAISIRRSEIRRAEKQKRIATAIELLKEKELLTSCEIRKLSNKGELSTDDRLAHETANTAAVSVGWDDEVHGYENGEPIKIMPDAEDFDVAISLVKQNINTDKLAKQRRGYLAVEFPTWTAHQFKTELERTDSQLVLDGLGLETPAINDDRFLGQLLTKLLNRLIGTVFDTASLAIAVREVLQSHSENGKTFGSEIEDGALGASAYRKARFLHCSGDDFVIRWVRGFISEWYPARIAKKEDSYAFRHAKNVNLRLISFSRWLIHQPSPPDNMPAKLEISFQSTEIPDQNAELKDVARLRREAGETIKEIAESLNTYRNLVSIWCRGIKKPSPVESEVLGILRDGKVWKTSEVVAHVKVSSGFARQNVMTALKKLLDDDKICKMKRGFYQIQN